MSVESVAQAVYELATTGRLSEQTEEDIRGILGLVVDEETGVVVPEANVSDDDLDEDEDEDEKESEKEDKKEPAKATGAVKKGTK
jgi:uncharacterized protein YqhQ